MNHFRTRAAYLLPAIWALLLTAPLSAQTVAAAAGDAPLERLEIVRLKSGTVLRGLIEAKSKTHVDFIEFFRPQGKPMYAVARRIDLRRVDEVRPLHDEQRAALVRQAGRFRNRARIEQGRMESLSLTRREVDGSVHWSYRPPREQAFFTLRSTMDEEMTRRAIVRIEQIFTAYRRLMPPRDTPRQQLRIVLFGSLREYRDFIGRKQLGIDHPAFYSTRRNLIAAGSQLEGLRDALQKSQAKQAAILQEAGRLKNELPETLRKLTAKLKNEGLDEELIKQITGERRQRIETKLERLRLEARANDRRNAAKFDTLTARMFTRLYHEAFHAYLENYVYPGEQYDVPRWLNEGMAQVFEQGQLEDGLLRIDAPNRQTLVQLQDLLRGEKPISLAEVLSAKQSAFLVTHTGGVGSRQHYLISWGLAYYLTFDRPLLSREAMDRYADPEAAKMPPVARFERLVGTSLEQFEQDWRKAILAMRPVR